MRAKGPVSRVFHAFFATVSIGLSASVGFPAAAQPVQEAPAATPVREGSPEARNAAAKTPGPTDRLALLTLLRQGAFDRLDVRLKQFHAAYEAGRLSDRTIFKAYATFESADPKLAPLLDAWVKKWPESYTARMARGIYYQHLGTLSRGLRWAEDTPKQRVAAMKTHYGRAKADFRAALKANPTLGVAHAALVVMAMIEGKRPEADRIVRAGRDADPRSFTIRHREILTHLPWWRGESYWGQLMRGYDRLVYALRAAPEQAELRPAAREVIAAATRDAKANPGLAPLKGGGDYIIAATLSRHGYRPKADRYFNRALKFGDYWWYLLAKGENQFKMKRYRAAVKTFTRALKAWPQAPRLLDWRARTYVKLKRFGKAAADWKMALALDPKNPEILVHKARAARQRKKFADVLAALDEATVYGAHEQDVWHLKSELYIRDLKRPADAVAPAKRATEINPKVPRYWRNYAAALRGTAIRAQQCAARAPLTRYRALCEAGKKRCAKDGTKWAARTLAELSRPGQCPASPG